MRKAGRQSSKTGFSTSYTTSTTTFTNTNSFAQNSSDQGLGHLVSCRNNLGNALSNSVKLSEEQPQQQLKLSQHLKLSEEEPQHQLKLSEEQLQQHLKLSEEQTQQHLKLTEEQPQQQSSHLVLQQPQGGDQQQAFTILRGQPVSQTDYLEDGNSSSIILSTLAIEAGNHFMATTQNIPIKADNQLIQADNLLIPADNQQGKAENQLLQANTSGLSEFFPHHNNATQQGTLTISSF